MIYGIVMSLLVAGAGYLAIRYWWLWIEATHVVELGRQEAEATGASMASMVSEIDHLVDQLAEQRIACEEKLALMEQRSAEELRRREHAAQQRQDSLISQVQNLSERIASLKFERVQEDGEVIVDGPPQWAPPEPRAAPYSQGLFDFLNAMETEEAKYLVEDYIEAQRAVGRDDEQILDQLNRGEYVNG